MKMNSGIYKIQHVLSGKVYIGSAVNLSRRFKEHRVLLKANRHHSSKLQNAWNKYGSDGFIFEILLVCEKQNLIMYEQAFIDFHDACKEGYNSAPKAGSCLGKKHSQQTKDKMSISQRLRTKESWLLGAIASAAAKKGRFKHSQKTKDKLRLLNLGKKHSDTTKLKMRLSHVGSRKNYKHSDEVKMKIGIACKLRKHLPHSKETRIKMRVSRIAYVQKIKDQQLNLDKENSHAGSKQYGSN